MIVRCIQHLEETCRDVRNAARVIGDPVLVLFQKMQEGSKLIKRDIVFAVVCIPPFESKFMIIVISRERGNLT